MREYAIAKIYIKSERNWQNKLIKYYIKESKIFQFETRLWNFGWYWTQFKCITRLIITSKFVRLFSFFFLLSLFSQYCRIFLFLKFMWFLYDFFCFLIRFEKFYATLFFRDFHHLNKAKKQSRENVFFLMYHI